MGQWLPGADPEIRLVESVVAGHGGGAPPKVLQLGMPGIGGSQRQKKEVDMGETEVELDHEGDHVGEDHGNPFNVVPEGGSTIGKPRIYCFINSNEPGWIASVSMAEDGNCLAQHVSSTVGYAVQDSGFSVTPGSRAPGNKKRETFLAHYPDGYVLEWVEDARPGNCAGLDAAYKRNHQLQSEAGLNSKERGLQHE